MYRTALARLRATSALHSPHSAGARLLSTGARAAGSRSSEDQVLAAAVCAGVVLVASNFVISDAVCDDKQIEVSIPAGVVAGTSVVVTNPNGTAVKFSCPSPAPVKVVDEKTKAIVDGLIKTYSETTGTKVSIPGSDKDSAEFKYIKFDEMPKFTKKHRSAMAKFLTPAVWEKLKDLKTSKGYTIHNSIQTGALLPHLGVGACGGDEESWDMFKDLFYPIIKDWHGYDANTQKHPTDLDPSKLKFTSEQQKKFDEYVVSTRIRAARNIAGFALPCGATVEERAGVEKVLKQAFAGLSGDLAGTYYELGAMSDKDRDFLLENGFLFQIPTARNLLMGAGAARDWPDNRGIFHNANRTALAWCNEEDHCRIISMELGGNIPSVFARFCALSEALKASATANGTKLMWNETLGFLGTCPSNLGTGLRASVMVKLKCFNKILEDKDSSHEDKELLEQVCDAFDLQPRGSAGEHSPAKDAKFDVSNKQRLGFSEVELVQKMIDGVSKVIELEEMLAGGASPADVRAKVKAMKA